VSSSVESFSPGPFPVITTVCKECGIVDVVNEEVEWDENRSLLSPGLRLTALIVNCLTEGQPMYRLPDFFEKTDAANLFGEEITPENLNDHTLGRALDKLAEAGPRTVLGTVLLEAAAQENVSTNVLHADTTSFSVQGLYETEEDTEETLSITHGYSKDNRPDLKQFQVGLGVNRAGVPIVGDILDGNTADTTWNTELIGKLRQRLAADEPPIYVADSKVVNQESLDEAAAEGISIISRIPRTYNAVDALIDRAWKVDDWTDLGKFVNDEDDEDAASYQIQTFQKPISGHDMRCVVVHSSTLDGRTNRRIDNNLDSTEEDIEDAVGRLADRSFACEPDAHEAWRTWLDDHDDPCFEFDAEIVETEQKKSREKPGRPPNDWEPYETVYKIAASVQRDAAAIAHRKKRESCFVVVTSLEDEEEWPAEQVLREYKEQQAVERRFPVLKDPKRVGPVFLDRPERVEALGYVLLMALLVYSLIERRAREALKDADEPMQLSGGPTSYRPTGRRVLERFENVQVVHIEGKRELPDNESVPRRVLELLGLDTTIYGVEPEV
jgi:transposase